MEGEADLAQGPFGGRAVPAGPERRVGHRPGVDVAPELRVWHGHVAGLGLDDDPAGGDRVIGLVQRGRGLRAVQARQVEAGRGDPGQDPSLVALVPRVQPGRGGAADQDEAEQEPEHEARQHARLRPHGRLGGLDRLDQDLVGDGHEARIMPDKSGADDRKIGVVRGPSVGLGAGARTPASARRPVSRRR